jgi:pyrimidine deaminase RibD-like protein
MQLALDEARKSPPKPTNFCVGACLVSQTLSPSESEDDHLTRNTTLLGTGFTLECPGNTHAEQSCFIKLAAQYGCTLETLGEHLPPNTALALYTTMEPCNRRSPGNTPCVDRILAIRRENGDMAIKQVYVGVTEPETFVGINEGRQKIEAAGIEVIHVPGLEKEILAVATSGHIKDESS